MSNITKCKSCRREFEIPATAGAEVRCPYCQAVSAAKVVRVQFEPRKLSPLTPVTGVGAMGATVAANPSGAESGGAAETVLGEALRGGEALNAATEPLPAGSPVGGTADPNVPPVRDAMPTPHPMPSGEAARDAGAAPLFQTGVLPHRGSMILTQGIITCVLATVGGAICTPVFFIASVIGIVVIYNARKDLKQMAAGTMDRRGHALTLIGMSLAVVGIVIVALILGGLLVAALVFMAEGRGWIK